MRVNGLHVTPCHTCGFIIEGAQALDETRPAPSRGSLMICIACGALSVVDESPALGLYMRAPTAVEHGRALADPDVVRVLAARAIIQRRAGEDWNP